MSALQRTASACSRSLLSEVLNSSTRLWPSSTPNCMRLQAGAATRASPSDEQREESSSMAHQESIRSIRERIFGSQPRMKDGAEVLSRKLQGKEVASWYFLPPTDQPGFHNEENEYVAVRNLNRRQKQEPEAPAGDATPKKKK